MFTILVPTGNAYFFVAHCEAVGTKGLVVGGAVTKAPLIPPCNSINEVQLVPPSVEV